MCSVPAGALWREGHPPLPAPWYSQEYKDQGYIVYGIGIGQAIDSYWFSRVVGVKETDSLTLLDRDHEV